MKKGGKREMVMAKQKSRNLAMLLVMIMLFGLLPMTSPLVAEAAGSEKPYITVTGRVYGNEGYSEDNVPQAVYDKSGGTTIKFQGELRFKVSEAVYLETAEVQGQVTIKKGDQSVKEEVYAEKDAELTVTGNPDAAVKITLKSVADNSKTSTFIFVVGKEDSTEPQKADLTNYNNALNQVNEADYTLESWAIYQEVVNRNVVTEENTQEEVNQATRAILEAQGNLVPVGGTQEPIEPKINIDYLYARSTNANVDVNVEDVTWFKWIVLEGNEEINVDEFLGIWKKWHEAEEKGPHAGFLEIQYSQWINVDVTELEPNTEYTFYAWAGNEELGGMEKIISKTFNTAEISSEKQITYLELYKDGKYYEGKIDEVGKTIEVIVPEDLDITELGAYIELSREAKVSVNGEDYDWKKKYDFSKPVVFTVTAEDGSTVYYTVTVIKAVFIKEQTAIEGKVDLSEVEALKPGEDGKTKPAIVPICVEKLGRVEIQLPSLTLGKDEKLVLEVSVPELELNKPLTALNIKVPGLGTQKVTLTLPIPYELIYSYNEIAGFHQAGDRWEYRKATRGYDYNTNTDMAIFTTNLSTVLVGEAVEVPELKLVSKDYYSVTLAVYSEVENATFEFFANGNKVTATKVKDTENQYNVTGLSHNTKYDITAIAIDTDGFESATSAAVTVTTNKKSSSGGSSNSGGGGGGSTSTSTNTVKYDKSATVKGQGVTIDFPANAMDKDFDVKIAKVSSTSRLPMPSNMKFAGDVFEITKNRDGDFDKDVTITLPFDKSKVDFDKYDVSLFWLNEKTDKWIELDNIRVNKSSETVKGEVDHFTKFAVLAIEKDVEEEDTEEKPEVSLRDIRGHWAEAHISKLIETGAISGYPDGTFKPDNNITRAEFATVLVKALELEETTGKVFADTANHWARKYIATAAANGIVSGYNENAFGADDLITREQMAVMIVKSARLKNSTPYTEFADATKISSWAKSAVDTASYNDIIKGYPDGTFRPQNNATRAEAVTVIGKIL